MTDKWGTDWHDVLERSVWTFIQGFIGAVTAVPLVTDTSGWTAVAVAGATGGVSAVLSLLKTLAQERLGKFDTRSD